MGGGRRGVHSPGVRMLVLWNACQTISSAEDARWVREETDKLRACGGVAALRLHQVQSAALRHPAPSDWCLELDLRAEPRAVVRSPACAEFLADLTLLGARPSVLVLP